MKTYIPLDRLKRSRDSGSALYNMPPVAVLGRAGGGVSDKSDESDKSDKSDGSGGRTPYLIHLNPIYTIFFEANKSKSRNLENLISNFFRARQTLICFRFGNI